jgi:hypothetical protein
MTAILFNLRCFLGFQVESKLVDFVDYGPKISP